MTIAVIGAGASGMMAALTAAETPENKILLFERQARVGRKLAVTGNGRCNLTNTGAAPENYHGAQPEFAARTLAAFPPAAALDWFAAHGLLTVTEPGGRVYPLSNAANSVVDVLRFALAQPNITLHTGDAVTAVRRQGRGFVVETEGGQFPAERVIIACGGIAGAKAGGVRVMATGRSDFPNQVNNVLCFPGLFKGALSVRARDINNEMKLAAAYAIADLITDADRSEENIIPGAFDPRVAEAVANAVAKAARETGVARL